MLQPLQAEDGVTFHIISVVEAKADTTRGTLLILNPDEEILKATRDWAKPYVDDRMVLAGCHAEGFHCAGTLRVRRITSPVRTRFWEQRSIRAESATSPARPG